MGYESRIYVVQGPFEPPVIDIYTKITGSGHIVLPIEDLEFAQVLAFFDLGKMMSNNNFSDLMKKSGPTRYYIYDVDGNTQINKDDYNHRLKQFTINDLADAIEKDKQEYLHSEDGSNKRFNADLEAFLAYLDVLRDRDWLYALHYGY